MGLFKKKKVVEETELLRLWGEFSEDMKVDLASRWMKADKKKLYKLVEGFEKVEPAMVQHLKSIHADKEQILLEKTY